CRSRTSSSNNRTNQQLHGRNRPRRRTTSRISRKTKHPNKPIQTIGTWGQGTWGHKGHGVRFLVPFISKHEKTKSHLIWSFLVPGTGTILNCSGVVWVPGTNTIGTNTILNCVGAWHQGAYRFTACIKCMVSKADR